MAHELPKLPYPTDALEPHIDKMTMEIHQGKHHNAYVTNLNKALEGAADVQKWSLDDICRNIAKVPENIRTDVRNNGGGHWNHSLFWTQMGPKKGGEPKGKLADVIKSTFTDFANFKTKFKEAGVGRFGSGWAWLARTADSTRSFDANRQPAHGRQAPGVARGEHASPSTNRRPDYIEAQERRTGTVAKRL